MGISCHWTVYIECYSRDLSYAVQLRSAVGNPIRNDSDKRDDVAVGALVYRWIHEDYLLSFAAIDFRKTRRLPVSTSRMSLHKASSSMQSFPSTFSAHPTSAVSRMGLRSSLMTTYTNACRYFLDVGSGTKLSIENTSSNSESKGTCPGRISGCLR
jgi:hypothetical protein